MTKVTPDLSAANGRTVRLLVSTGPIETRATGRCADLTDEQLGAVAAYVGGCPIIASDALKMRPWPSWLMDVLFPGRKSRP